MSARLARIFLCAFHVCTVAAFGVGAEPEQVPASADPTFSSKVQPFLTTYCGGCHGAKQQKGERRFDTLPGEIGDDNVLVDYQDILDQLNLSDMPPREAKQPADNERRQVIRWLTQQIAQYHAARQTERKSTTLRRLNAREYRNTIRDLLHLHVTMFDPAAKFPQDQTSEHFDNIGDTLVTSGFLLARYLEAAERAVNKALLPLKKPEVQRWAFHDGFRQQPEIDQVHRRTTQFKHLILYEVVGADKHEGAYAPILAFREGVPHDGYYDIRLRAEAVNRLHPYDPEFLGTDPAEPLRLGIVAGDQRAGQLHKPQPVEPLLGELELADESKWYTVRVWLDAGMTPRFTFRNGLMDVRTLWSRLLRKYPDQFPKPKRGGIVEARYNAIAYGKLPQIHIHEVEISGPFYDSWPTPAQRAVLGEDCEQILSSGSLTDQQRRRLLVNFMSQAYRRPVEEAEVDRIEQLVRARQSAGRSSLEACTDGLKAVLCSPSFLYLVETGSMDAASGQPVALSSYELASRLSYFLWSSMPDERLLQLAAEDALRNPDVLQAEARRLLADERSAAFIDGFLGSWLHLRELGATPPDRNQFRAYYHYDLESAMRRETQLFVRHLIDENLNIALLLDADFTFVNKPLARLYNLPPPAQGSFQKVTLPDRRRGGLLGQASVLTVTANGIDTSPVVRGVWLLENILGTPPSPPPPDVEPLDPDVRGATTIRDQLAKHRNTASCYDCHRAIDPLGFALENFDPVGRWRDKYNRSALVDASGELPSGETFDDIRGLKTILVKNRSQFARALTEKLLAYALGRRLTPLDRPQVDQLLARLDERDQRMRDLLELIVVSDIFRRK